MFYKLKERKLKLTIELVPETSWYNNLRKVMSKEQWDMIRHGAYADAHYQCEICNTKGKLNCHEKWEYDDKAHTQKLVGFIALCDLCHHVKHIGFAAILANQGQLDYETVVQHFMKVNECSRDFFNEYRDRAFDKWQERSDYNWTVNLGNWENIIKKGGIHDT